MAKATTDIEKFKHGLQACFENTKESARNKVRYVGFYQKIEKFEAVHPNPTKEQLRGLFTPTELAILLQQSTYNRFLDFAKLLVDLGADENYKPPLKTGYVARDIGNTMGNLAEYLEDSKPFIDGLDKVIKNTTDTKLKAGFNGIRDKIFQKGGISYDRFMLVATTEMLQNLVNEAAKSEQYELLGLIYKYSYEIINKKLNEELKKHPNNLDCVNLKKGFEEIMKNSEVVLQAFAPEEYKKQQQYIEVEKFVQDKAQLTIKQLNQERERIENNFVGLSQAESSKPLIQELDLSKMPEKPKSNSQTPNYSMENNNNNSKTNSSQQKPLTLQKLQETPTKSNKDSNSISDKKHNASSASTNVNSNSINSSGQHTPPGSFKQENSQSQQTKKDNPLVNFFKNLKTNPSSTKDPNSAVENPKTTDNKARENAKEPKSK